jgi:hypothetical protein
MNEAQHIIQDIYDNNLEARLRIIADDLTINEASGHGQPHIQRGRHARIDAEHTTEVNLDLHGALHDDESLINVATETSNTAEDVAVAEPTGIYNPVYLGDNDGLTVTANPHSLNDAYATLTHWPTDGPYIQPHDNTTLNVHYHDPTKATTPNRVDDADVPVYDQAHLAHYLQGPNPRTSEFGVTTVEINPDKQPSDAVISITNDEAYHARRRINMNNTPLGNQTDNPARATDQHITKQYR